MSLHEYFQNIEDTGIDLNCSGIYIIRNKLNKKFYIGSSVCFKKRFSVHKHRLRKGVHENAHLQNSWNKNGADAFEFIPVEIIESDFLFIREQEHLDNKTYDYNISTIAGSGPSNKWTEEQKLQISRSLGFEPVLILDENEKEHTIHTIAGFCRQHNLQASIIGKVLKGERKWHKGWHLPGVCISDYKKKKLEGLELLSFINEKTGESFSCLKANLPKVTPSIDKKLVADSLVLVWKGKQKVHKGFKKLNLSRG